MTQEEGLAIVAIQKTMAMYNRAADEARMADIAATFAEDGQIEIPGAVFVGRDQVRGFFDARLENALKDIADNRRARHYITTSQIDITGPDTATGATYFLLIRTGQIEQMGSYLDRFKKVGGEWMIAYRNVVLHWMV